MNFQDELRRARQYHESGDYSRAEKGYLNILETMPGNSDTAYLLGLLYHQTNRFKMAIDRYKESISTAAAPQGQVYLHLGLAYFAVNQLNESLAAIENVLRLTPGHVDALMTKARIFSKAGYIEQANACLLEILQRHPNLSEKMVESQRQLAGQACYFSAITKSERKKSVDYLKMAVGLYEKLSQGKNSRFAAAMLYNAAQLRLFFGDYDLVKRYLREACLKDPEFKEPRVMEKLVTAKLKPVKKYETPHTILFHIGYPKTGTTWLQCNFFPFINGCAHLGRHHYDLVGTEKQVEAEFGLPCFNSEPHYTMMDPDADMDAFCKALKNTINMDYAASTISDESLAMYPEMVSRKASYVASSLGLPAKIIMVIRQQHKIILSQYAQGVKEGRWPAPSDLESVLNWESRRFDRKYMAVKLYDYWYAYQTIAKGVGEENVLVIPFETLFTVESLNRILCFSGVDFDAEMTPVFLEKRAMNITRKNEKTKEDSQNPEKDKLKTRIDSFFKVSNSKLSNHLNLDLGTFGYF